MDRLAEFVIQVLSESCETILIARIVKALQTELQKTRGERAALRRAVRLGRLELSWNLR